MCVCVWFFFFLFGLFSNSLGLNLWNQFPTVWAADVSAQLFGGGDDEGEDAWLPRKHPLTRILWC